MIGVTFQLVRTGLDWKTFEEGLEKWRGQRRSNVNDGGEDKTHATDQ